MSCRVKVSARGTRHGSGLLLTGSLMNTDASTSAAVDKDKDGEAVSVVYVDGEPQQQTVVALDAIQGILRNYQDAVVNRYGQNASATLGVEGKYNMEDGNTTPRTPRRPDFFRTLGIRGKSNRKRK